MSKGKTWYSPNEAISILKKAGIKVSRPTFLGNKPTNIVGWVNSHGLGEKLGGRWIIYSKNLENFMNKNFKLRKVYEKKRQNKKK